MTDKIVQLIDKDGDNIYPVSSVVHGVTMTMTATDPGEGSTLEADHYIGVYGGDPIIMDYSTTSEVNTGAKWIDGNSIYKKTVNFGSLPNTSSKNVAHGIANLGQVIKVEGISRTSSVGDYVPLPYPSAAGGASGTIDVKISSTYVIVDTASDRSSFVQTFITVYYTKS